MVYLPPAADSNTVAALLAISFFAFVIGTVLRKWPDKVEKLTENIDGYAWLISSEANRAMIASAGALLVATSFVALFLASWML